MKLVTKKKTLLADLGLLYAAAIWGSTFFIVKESLKHIDPVMLVGYRFLLAAIILGFIVYFQKKRLFNNWKHGFVLGFILWLLYISQTIGLKYTTASNSGFITGLFILFVPIFSMMFFRTKLSIAKLFSVFLALLGLWLLTGGLKEINIGDMLTLIAAVTYAFHILFADKYIKKKSDPYVLSFQQFFFIGVLSIITGIVFQLPTSFGTINTLRVVLFLTLFPTVSAFVIQLIAQKYTTPVKVALIFSMEPVFAAVFAWTLGNEVFIRNRAMGGLIIVIAMILSELPLEKLMKNAKQLS